MRRGPAILCTVGAVLAAGTQPAASQGWRAQLVLSPLPSPYLSDWEVDPTIGELIVTNSTATTTDVLFHYTLTHDGRLVLRGVTDPQSIPAGQSQTFDGASTFGGSADWDRAVQDLVTRTGRLPEGEYEACVTITDPGGFVLVERQCVQFGTEYPDPPALVFPLNGDTVTTQDPIFEWLPVDLSSQADGRLGYVLRIAEVNAAAGQRPETALESNIPLDVEPDLVGTSYQYPVGALPFVPGHTYAWRVQALDGEGLPVAANQGRSEVWTFVYAEPEGQVDRPVASIALTPRRDTLHYAGDTARFEARAYDADNIEIPGKRFLWRSTDTTVAKVDSTGVVTGVGAGETRIAASVGSIADSASSVTAVATGLAVRFERYDAASDHPSLLQVIQSGPPEEVVPKLMVLLQSGEFRIPIPRLPGVPGNDGDPGTPDTGGPQQEGAGGGGPRVAGQNPPWDGAADTQCSDIRVQAEASYDAARKVFVVPLSHDAERVEQACVHVTLDSVMVVDSTPAAGPPECTPGAGGVDSTPGGGRRDSTAASCPPPGSRWDVDTTYNVGSDTMRDTTSIGARAALFVISWAHPGLPRVFVTFKGRGSDLDIPGTALRARYWVINLLRATTVGSDVLPESYAGFFGEDSFDVGWGLTIFARRRCPKLPQSGLCSLVARFNSDSILDFTVQMFAGITASETSVGGASDSRDSQGRFGTSLALGFSIHGTLPVRTYDLDIGGLSIDSSQVGLQFSVQDSIVTGGGEGPHNLSIGVAPTLAVWLTGSGGNQWEVDGSIGVEWDPAKGRWPHLVFFAQLTQIWQLWWLRLGDPTLVLTTPIGPRVEQEATTLALSGTWGFGPNNGIGIADSTSAGGVSGDIGSGAIGGQRGFEQMGRGGIAFSWARLPAPLTRDAAKQARDSAIVAVTRQLHVVQVAQERERLAKIDVGLAHEGAGRGAPAQSCAPGSLCPGAGATSDAQKQRAADSAYAVAKKALDDAQATLDRLRRERDAARDATGPPKCWKTVQGRCLNWSARLSVGPGALMDLFVQLNRVLTGTQ